MRTGFQLERADLSSLRSASGAPTVVDDFLPLDWFHTVASEFPPVSAMDPPVGTSAYRKRGTADPGCAGPETRRLVAELQSKEWLEHFGATAGIGELRGDPDFQPDLFHHTEAGGYLRIHRDGIRDPARTQFRRLALLLYFHETWDPAWGGNLEFWSPWMRRRLDSLAPLPNRAVIFRTTPSSWHGVPDPLRCPPGVSRRVLSLFYWSETGGTGRAWRRADHRSAFRHRPRSDDPSRFAMRQWSLRPRWARR